MAISEPTTTILSYLPYVIMRIIANHSGTIEALAATSMDSLNYAILYSRYKNAINLTYALYCSKNLAEWFTILETKNEVLILECDTTITNHNMLTTHIM
jgi:hypothetical protein